MDCSGINLIANTVPGFSIDLDPNFGTQTISEPISTFVENTNDNLCPTKCSVLQQYDRDSYCAEEYGSCNCPVGSKIFFGVGIDYVRGNFKSILSDGTSFICEPATFEADASESTRNCRCGITETVCAEGTSCTCLSGDKIYYG